jgi:hypothetical protein
MQAVCLALTNFGEGNLIRNTLIRAETHAGKLLAELARATPAEAGNLSWIFLISAIET